MLCSPSRIRLTDRFMQAAEKMQRVQEHLQSDKMLRLRNHFSVAYSFAYSGVAHTM